MTANTTAHSTAHSPDIHTNVSPEQVVTNAPHSSHQATHLPALSSRLQALLDAAVADMQAGAFVSAFRRMGAPLSALWTEARSTQRCPELLALARAHPAHAMVQQDPYTHRAASKPRGYAGDAVMMDYVYSGQPPQGCTPLGAGIFAATTRCPMGLSVRYRRQLLRSLIDDTVACTHSARILSVASGHCREIDGSLVQQNWFEGDVVALDQDPLSCAEVQRAQSGYRVRAVEKGVRELLSKAGASEDLGQFDLIYSAGLYDYLPDAMAQRLTARMVQMLKPGGRGLVANFVPTGSGRGYMEMFMDWTLITRSAAQMQAMCEAAGAQVVATQLDPHNNVVYVEFCRRGAA